MMECSTVVPKVPTSSSSDHSLLLRVRVVGEEKSWTFMVLLYSR